MSYTITIRNIHSDEPPVEIDTITDMGTAIYPDGTSKPLLGTHEITYTGTKGQTLTIYGGVEGKIFRVAQTADEVISMMASAMSLRGNSASGQELAEGSHATPGATNAVMDFFDSLEDDGQDHDPEPEPAPSDEMALIA